MEKLGRGGDTPARPRYIPEFRRNGGLSVNGFENMRANFAEPEPRRAEFVRRWNELYRYNFFTQITPWHTDYSLPAGTFRNEKYILRDHPGVRDLEDKKCWCAKRRKPEVECVPSTCPYLRNDEAILRELAETKPGADEARSENVDAALGMKFEHVKALFCDEMGAVFDEPEGESSDFGEDGEQKQGSPRDEETPHHGDESREFLTETAGGQLSPAVHRGQLSPAVPRVAAEFDDELVPPGCLNLCKAKAEVPQLADVPVVYIPDDFSAYSRARWIQCPGDGGAVGAKLALGG